MRRINRKTERRSNLLDRLQEESWQLELIVSGVVIFLLLGAYDTVESLTRELGILDMGNSMLSTLSMFLVGCFLFSYLLLVTMFLLHLVLRGMWIGAIGLRSVSGDFNFEALNYRPKFQNFLHHRLGTFDAYIERLEKNASIAFSLAFLLFFAILSFGLFFGAITLGFILITGAEGDYTALANSRGATLTRITFIAIAVWVIVMLLAGLLYLLDFLTLGWLKKRSWFHKVYYPIYRFLGWVTLAHLYRPFYYNIIDDPFGKRLVRIYLLLAFLAVFSTSFTFTPFPHFSYSLRQPGVINAGSYIDIDEDLARSQNNYRHPSLGSRFAKEDYLEVFVPNHSSRHRNILRHRFPALRPLTPSTLNFMDFSDYQNVSDEQVDSTLQALSAIHRVYLDDSLIRDVNWKFYKHPVREQPGLLYDLPVYNLPRGEHLLRIEDQNLTRRKRRDKKNQQHRDSTYWQEWITISFMR